MYTEITEREDWREVRLSQEIKSLRNGVCVCVGGDDVEVAKM